MHSLYRLLVTAIVLTSACNDSSPVDPIVEDGPIDHFEIVVAGRVVDAEARPVPGALVEVAAYCLTEPPAGCMTGTSLATDSEGQFEARLDHSLQVEFPVRVEVKAWPPLGKGYALGAASLADLEGMFQAPPVADTTFVEVVLSSNEVDPCAWKMWVI